MVGTKTPRGLDHFHTLTSMLRLFKNVVISIVSSVLLEYIKLTKEKIWSTGLWFIWNCWSCTLHRQVTLLWSRATKSLASSTGHSNLILFVELCFLRSPPPEICIMSNKFSNWIIKECKIRQHTFADDSLLKEVRHVLIMLQLLTLTPKS